MKRDISFIEINEGGGGYDEDDLKQKSKRYKEDDNMCNMIIENNDENDKTEMKKNQDDIGSKTNTNEALRMIDSHNNTTPTSSNFMIKETNHEYHIASTTGCVEIITNNNVDYSIQSKNEKQEEVSQIRTTLNNFSNNIAKNERNNKCEKISSSTLHNNLNYCSTTTTDSIMTIVNNYHQSLVLTSLIPRNVSDDDMISSSSDSDSSGSSSSTDNEETIIRRETKVNLSFNNNDESIHHKPLIMEQIQKLSVVLRLLRFICMTLLIGVTINFVIYNELSPMVLYSPRSVLSRHYPTNDIDAAAVTSSLSSSSSIYVAGGGFSGFWYTIGRLQSMDHQRKVSSEYYCYSAGCLAVIASLNNFTMEHMYHIASDKQKQWHNGIINRYDVVPYFINDLLSFHNQMDNSNTSNVINDDNMKDDRQQQQDMVHPLQDSLSRIHVITTELRGDDNWFSYLKPQYRQASTIEELKQLLIQTTWIPYVVGNGLSYNGHLDGAFSTFRHSTYDYNVGLTWDIELLTNFININLSYEQVQSLWNKGLQYGV